MLRIARGEITVRSTKRVARPANRDTASRGSRRRPAGSQQPAHFLDTLSCIGITSGKRLYILQWDTRYRRVP